MKDVWYSMKTGTNRRSFLKNGLAAAGMAAAGAGLLFEDVSASAHGGPEEHSGTLTSGDAALLRFAAAAEILETDFWVQYNELGGSKIAKSRVEAGIPPTLLPLKCWTLTWLSTSTIIRMTNSLTKIS